MVILKQLLVKKICLQSQHSIEAWLRLGLCKWFPERGPLKFKIRSIRETVKYFKEIDSFEPCSVPFALKHFR